MGMKNGQITNGEKMADNPCNFCSGDPDNCRDMGVCDIYDSVVICNECGNIAYKYALIDKELCPKCKQNLLKTYYIELRGDIKVKALDVDDAHDKAREEITDCELDVIYCDEV